MIFYNYFLIFEEFNNSDVKMEKISFTHMKHLTKSSMVALIKVATVATFRFQANWCTWGFGH